MTPKIENKIQFENAINMANKNLGIILGRGKKYVERNAPKYLRNFLLVPYYITYYQGKKIVNIIQQPDETHPKIYFSSFWLED